MRISKRQSLSPFEDDELENTDLEVPKGWLRKTFYYITMSPSDLQLIFYEQIESIDWDSKAINVARPLGIGSTITFYLLRLIQDNVVKPNYYKIRSNQNTFDLSKSETLKKLKYLKHYSSSTISVEMRQYDWFKAIDTAINCMLYLLLIINIRISYVYVYKQYKLYSIFGMKPTKQSPNLTKKSLDDLSKSYYRDISKKNIWSMIKYFIFEKANGDMLNRELNDKYFYTLNKWNPTKFVSQLFVFFNPMIIGFLWLTDVSFVTILIVILSWTILDVVILQRYEIKLIDESIISAATINDMNKKIINPNVNKIFQNVMVDATDRKHTLVKFEPTIVHNPIFETHSLNGDLIREKYNKQTFEFENVSDETNPHNRIMN